MPQPVKKDLSLTPDAFALHGRAQLAVHIAIIAAIWTEVEYELGYLLAVIMGADADVGIHIFQEVKSEAPQRSVIAAIGDRYLFGKDKETLTDIMEEMRKRSRERNLVVHAVWSIHDDYPNALIRIDDKRLVKQAAAFQTDQNRKGRARNALLAHALKYDGPMGMVYVEADFDAIEKRLIALQLTIMGFANELQRRRTDALERSVASLRRR